MKKLCKSCNKEKDIESFYGKNGEYSHHNFCKSCFNSFDHQKITERKRVFINFLGGKCAHCKIKHNKKNSVIFDFHHKVEATKEADWTRMRRWRLERIREEMKKCIVLCSNCHRIVHGTGHKKK